MRTILVAALVFGCGGGGGAGGNIPLDQLPTVFRQDYCNYLLRCGDFPDVATCLGANFGFTLSFAPNLAAAVTAGKVIYDGSKAGECYSAFGAASCDRTAQDGLFRAFSPACFEAIRGTVAANGSCALDAECVSQKCTIPTCTMACCTGTCTGATPPASGVAIGQPCTSTFECAAGGYCDTTSTCAALKPAGSACMTTNECAYDLGCVGAPSPTCKVLPTIGQACPDNQCRDDGTYCNSSKTCAKVGLPGSACTTQQDCSPFYVCDATNHCAQGPGLGQACSASQRCFSAATLCDATTSTCVGLYADGTACTSNSDCQSNQCTGSPQVCTTPAVCV